MRRFFAMMRYNKKLLAITICLLIDLIVILGLCVFDIIQLINISKNSATISSAFVVVNIVLISLMVLNFIILVATIVVKRHKEKEYEFKQN